MANTKLELSTLGREEDKDNAPRVEKLQQQVEELCGASVRAASGEAEFRFRSRRPEIAGKPSGIRAPHLQPDLNSDDFRSFRGAADGISLRLKFSDIDLHRSLTPKSAVGQLIFELMEQLRVESLVSDEYPGMKKNLRHRFEQWCFQFHSSGLTESHVGLLVYTIGQMVWSRLTLNHVMEMTEELIEPQRMMLAPHTGKFMTNIRKASTDQTSYAEQALGIVGVVDELVEAYTASDGDDDDKEDVDMEELASSFGLILYPDAGLEGEQAAGANIVATDFRELMKQLEEYSVYSRDNDREIHASKLVSEDQRLGLRDELDQRIKGQGVNVPRLARDLSQLLSAPRREGWNFGEEDGYLDARRLTRLVTSPEYRQIFRKERYQPHSNCLVTFLMDNSGSMKTHIGSIATLMEIMCRALEQAGASTEILGFTTRAWQGGKTYKQWQRRGKPANPGRLTELEHIVYKDADTPIKRARLDIAAMLKPSLFREGIDGEALLWASNRMAARSEERRILIVLSDGCPMETATNQNNPEDYLDNHLQQVAGMLETRGDIELYALGFGLDLSTYYRHNLALELPERLENGIFKEILQMIAKHGRRSR